MQPKSMFLVVKPEFGFATQPLPVFIPLNIDFGCAWQPNSAFNIVNIDFGCASRRRTAGATDRKPTCYGAAHAPLAPTVRARVLTGDGFNYCGGEEFFSRLILVVPETGEPQPIFTLERDDLAEVTSVLDADGDDAPELRMAWWGADVLVYASGETQTLRQYALCVCGC